MIRGLLMADGDSALVVFSSAADLNGDSWHSLAMSGVSLVVFAPRGVEDPWVAEQLRRGATWLGEEVAS